MTKAIDGFGLDIPPTSSQIITLAQLHRKQLDEAIHHNEIRLGDFCLAQKSRIASFTKELDVQDRSEFYRIYNEELVRLSHDENAYPHEHEEINPTKIKISIAIICVAALILGFTFLSRIA